MNVYEKAKDVEQKLEKVKLNPAKIDKETFSGIGDFKENVVGLARDIRDASADKAHDAADYVRDRMDDLKTSGTDAVEKIEKRIQSKPGQSVAIAFVAGIVTSLLFGRRGA